MGRRNGRLDRNELVYPWFEEKVEIFAFPTPEIKTCHLTQKHLRESNISRCPKFLWRKNLEYEPTPADKRDPEVVSARNSAHRIQNMHPRVITSLPPCSPIFGAQPCLALSSRMCRMPGQPQKSISAGMFDSKFTARRGKKIRKPGLFKVINFASWVQLLINHGGRRLKENQPLSACSVWGAPTLSTRMQSPCLSGSGSAHIQSEVKRCQHLYWHKELSCSSFPRHSQTFSQQPYHHWFWKPFDVIFNPDHSLIWFTRQHCKEFYQYSQGGKIREQLNCYLGGWGHTKKKKTYWATTFNLWERISAPSFY